MAGDIERESEPPGVPTQQLPSQEQVGRTGNGKKLGEPLNDAKQRGDERGSRDHSVDQEARAFILRRDFRLPLAGALACAGLARFAARCSLMNTAVAAAMNTVE